MYNQIKHFGVVVMLCVAALWVGCSKEEGEVARMLQLSTYGLGFSAEGGTGEIVVVPHPADEAWVVDDTDTAEWISCSTSEGSIVVVAEPNEATESRQTTIDVISPSGSFAPITLTIGQEAADVVVLAVDAPESYEFDSAALSYTFGVSANTEWSIKADADWVEVEADAAAQRATISVEANDGDAERSAIVTIEAAYEHYAIAIVQHTHAQNPYYRLVGQWEITASKWFYSPNGSLNSLDYAPNPSDYYLIFDIEEAEYGKTLKMRDFLYPGTALEIRYDATSQGIIIPFGWTVLSYDVFCYVTLVGSSQFSYASMDVEALPDAECTTLELDLPTVDGFNYVGFGLWTYNDNGAKVALGSNYRPTMFPVGDVKFVKKSE